jgi:hypothetical protein
MVASTVLPLAAIQIMRQLLLQYLRIFAAVAGVLSTSPDV